MDVDPFSELELDHRLIEVVLTALEAARPDTVDAAFFVDVVAFVRDFADDVHHRHEERLAFPALEAAGVLRHMGPIGVMLAEHDDARELILRLEGLSTAGELAAACEAGRAYAALMRDHIRKEEQALFVIGRSVLGDDAAAELSDRIAVVGKARVLRASFQRQADAIAARVASSSA